MNKPILRMEDLRIQVPNAPRKKRVVNPHSVAFHLCEDGLEVTYATCMDGTALSDFELERINNDPLQIQEIIQKSLKEGRRL